MCYQLTACYGLSHGHAAAECLPAAWEMLVQASASDATLAETLENIAGLLQGKKKADAASGLGGLHRFA